MSSLSQRGRFIVTMITGIALSIGAPAIFILPTDAPVERLVQNLSKHLADHPQDGEAYYSLARTHALAFSMQQRTIVVYDANGPVPMPADDRRQETTTRLRLEEADRKGEGQAPVTAVLTQQELREHLVEGVRAYNRAIEISPDRAKYRLGLASLLEAGRKLAGEITVAPGINTPRADPEKLRHWHSTLSKASAGDDRAAQRIRDQLRTPEHDWVKSHPRLELVPALLAARDDQDEKIQQFARRMLSEDWIDQACDQYFAAFSLALRAEGKAVEQPMRGLGELVAFESGKAFERLVRERGTRPDDAVRLTTVSAGLKAFERLPPNRAVTPIVFSFSSHRTLSDLCDHTARVRFNLDGSDRPQQWPWLKPTTGLLCWDPANSRRITSGRQLFGSVSWWIFFDNGYQALDALDDNRDAALTGPELAGIAVWFDRNANGISDSGEVTPVHKLGVAAISCRATSTSDGCPANLQGISFTDGRVLPTYDWIADPAPGSFDESSPTRPLPLALAASCVALSAMPFIPRRRAK